MLRIIVFIFVTSKLYSQSIEYKLSMPKPQNHYFEVEINVSDWKKNKLVLEMPVWAPGSYLIRDFSKNVNLVKARNKLGDQLEVVKISKNKWSIDTKGIKEITVNYEVYSFELSVRTSFLDLSHGFVSGSGIFMTAPELSSKKGLLKIHPHENFKKITTPLDLVENKWNQFIYAFENFDHLVDSPIEIGNHEVFSFESVSVNHTVAIYGEGNFNSDKLLKDMSTIIKSCTDVFGFNPNKKYTFIIHNVSDGQGGLEHSNSCVLSVNRWSYSDNYNGFLSLVAHEYFHLWNVKRIRPIELGPFDYSKENYTSLLWMMEGFTSYYDELILLRAGFYSKKTFLNKLNSMINYVEGSNGSRIQPVSDASFDAWIKAYKPNENSHNVTMTYYSRGAIIASLLDAMIIERSKGEQCLDHFLRHMYEKYHVKYNRGFTEDELKKELAIFTGQNMAPFFERYIRGAEILPFEKVFSKIGVGVEVDDLVEISTGLRVNDISGKTIVNRIDAQSSAEDSGFSVGDEIIAVNGYRVNGPSFTELINTLGVNESVEVLISRDEKLSSLLLFAKSSSKPFFNLYEIEKTEKNNLFNYWLR